MSEPWLLEQVKVAEAERDRLAADLMCREQEIKTLWSALDRLLRNAESMVARKPVRDWLETITEAREARDSLEGETADAR